MGTNRKGIAYCVGVGPGDPEYMTLKGCRLIRENSHIIVPGKDPFQSAAYKIAVQAVPELTQKELMAVEMPMTKDRAILKTSHAEAAAAIERILDTGENAVYLTLGDPSVYCSFSYLKYILEKDGYETELVSGVTSFCAAAARLGTVLTENDDRLHIIPGLHSDETDLTEAGGNYVLMKSGRRMGNIKEMLGTGDYDVCAAENCGMDGERLYRTLEEIPDDPGYFTLIIAKDKR